MYLNYIAYGSKDLHQYLIERSDIHEKNVVISAPSCLCIYSPEKPSPYRSMDGWMDGFITITDSIKTMLSRNSVLILAQTKVIYKCPG